MTDLARSIEAAWDARDSCAFPARVERQAVEAALGASITAACGLPKKSTAHGRCING